MPKLIFLLYSINKGILCTKMMGLKFSKPKLCSSFQKLDLEPVLRHRVLQHNIDLIKF